MQKRALGSSHLATGKWQTVVLPLLANCLVSPDWINLQVSIWLFCRLPTSSFCMVWCRRRRCGNCANLGIPWAPIRRTAWSFWMDSKKMIQEFDDQIVAWSLSSTSHKPQNITGRMGNVEEKQQSNMGAPILLETVRKWVPLLQIECNDPFTRTEWSFLESDDPFTRKECSSRMMGSDCSRNCSSSDNKCLEPRHLRRPQLDGRQSYSYIPDWVSASSLIGILERQYT